MWPMSPLIDSTASSVFLLSFSPKFPLDLPVLVPVFRVSTNSMQLSFDTRGNSVPTILLMMHHRLYALGGLQWFGSHGKRSTRFENYGLLYGQSPLVELV